MCGSRRIRQQHVTVPFEDGSSATVNAEVCGACGETYFDREAMQALEAVDHRYRRKRARAAK